MGALKAIWRGIVAVFKVLTWPVVTLVFLPRNFLLTFDWRGLPFSDRLKLLTVVIQWMSGVAVSGYVVWATAHLTAHGDPWFVFVLATMAMITLIIILTGFAGLIYRRTIEIEAFGTVVRSIDSESAMAVANRASHTAEIRAQAGVEVAKSNAEKAAYETGNEKPEE